MNDLIHFARKALEAGEGNIDEALRLANKWRKEDASIDAQLIEPMIQVALRNAIEHEHRQINRRTWHGEIMQPSGEESEAPHRRAGLHVAGITSIMDRYRMRGGKPLGDCTPKELLEESAAYALVGATYAAKGKWFRLLSQRAKDKNMAIRKQLTDRIVESLMRKAKVEDVAA